MTVYYVGPGGNNGNAGTSWAARKLTLNSVEDIPVVAGDTVYVGPGVYREVLTIDVSGSSGNPITYIADVSGVNTDGVGGTVRITGSDSDQAATRTNCITASSKNYRTFRGFMIDTATSHLLSVDGTNWILEHCSFSGNDANVEAAVNFSGAGQAAHTVRNCVFGASAGNGIIITHSSTVNNAGHTITNCLFFGVAGGSGQVRVDRVGGITVSHCTFYSGGVAVRVFSALAAGQTVTVNNCLCIGGGFQASATGEITENYNTLVGGASRNTVSVGANSNTYWPLFQAPILLDDYRYPWNPFDLSQWSQVRRIAGTGMSNEDLYGITRPTTDSKKSWGAVQYNETVRETVTVRTGAAALRLSDAGSFQMFQPTGNVSTVFSCYVYWETDYTGTKPQMIIKQSGQSDVTVTATGSAGTWELLTTTLTPAANPGFCVVEFRSNNDATSGNFDVFFDDYAVS